jgi:hypothetical protein
MSFAHRFSTSSEPKEDQVRDIGLSRVWKAAARTRRRCGAAAAAGAVLLVLVAQWPVGQSWKLVKPKRSGTVIDGAIALAMAVSTLISSEPQAILVESH